MATNMTHDATMTETADLIAQHAQTLQRAAQERDPRARDHRWALGLEGLHASLDALDEADEEPADDDWLVPDTDRPVPAELLDPQVLKDAIRAEGLRAARAGNGLRERAAAALLASLRAGSLATVARGLVDQFESMLEQEEGDE